MKKWPIEICFIVDKPYVMPAYVAAMSAVMNKKDDSHYNIYFLCLDLETKDEKILKSLTAKNVHIKIIELKHLSATSKLKIEGISATTTSLYKFYLPEILYDLEKIIYIDGDVIVRDDLTELYNIDMGDNKLAAVKDANGLNNKKIDEGYFYFNSGVMVMNLGKMRIDGDVARLKKYRAEGLNKLMDQDAFNYVFKGSVQPLGFDMNTQVHIFSKTEMGDERYCMDRIIEYWGLDYDKNKPEAIIDNARILHYTTKAKPWKYCDAYGGDIWLDVYAESPYRKTRLRRQNYYIKDISSSNTYKIGKKIVRCLSCMSNIFKDRKTRRYEKFLKGFIYEKKI